MENTEKEESRMAHGWELLFLANGFTRFPEPSGGTKHFIEVARTWLEEGQELAVLTPKVGVDNCLTEDFSGPFRVLPPDWADRLGIMAMYLIRGFAAVFRLPWRKSHLLLYGTSDLLPDVLPCFLARIIKRNNVFWVNCVFHLIPAPKKRAGSAISNMVSYLAQRLSLRLIQSRCNIVIVDNRLLKEELTGIGFDPERIFVTFMGTDSRIVEGCEPTYDACYLGRLHPSKGIFDLVDIWGRVCTERPGSTLAIVGDGPQHIRERLEVEVRSAHLESVISILGFVPRDEVHKVLCSSRVFLFPSHEEGFGIGIVEGMGHGLPPVAYELPHYEQVFDTVPTLVPVGDTRRFAEEVVILLEDEELRKRKAGEAKQFASGYTWESVARREIDTILAALESRKTS